MDLTAIPLERLEAEIATQAAHIAAGTCRWLELVAEFDRREGYADWGCRSTAHWLNWRCGVSLVSGREQVRVGRRLAELPAVRAAFATGELSFKGARHRGGRHRGDRGDPGRVGPPRDRGPARAHCRPAP